jgi:hypothetical protein
MFWLEKCARGEDEGENGERFFGAVCLESARCALMQIKVRDDLVRIIIVALSQVAAVVPADIRKNAGPVDRCYR